MNKLQRKLFLYASLGTLVFVACSEDEGDLDPGTGPIDPGTSDTTGVTDSVAAPIVLLVDSLTWEELENKRTILYVDENRMESNDTIVDRDLRTFSTKELIKIKANSEGTGFCLTSWVCDTLNNVFLMAHPQGSGGSYILFYIDMLPPLAQFDYEIPYENSSLTIYNREDQPATITPGDGTTFSIETEDPLWKKLTEDIKMNWTATFSNYDPDTKYGDMTAIYAREWVTMLTNMAYMYSTPEFEYLVKNFVSVVGQSITGQNGVVFKDEDYPALYEKLIDDHDFVLGLVLNTANGYGGGANGQVFAVFHQAFYSHYNSMANDTWETLAHEYNHCIGYGGHTSNLVAEKGPFPSKLVPPLHNYLRKLKRLPYTNMFVFDMMNADYRHWWQGLAPINMEYDPETLEFYRSGSVYPGVEQWLNDNASLFE